MASTKILVDITTGLGGGSNMKKLVLTFIISLGAVMLTHAEGDIVIVDGTTVLPYSPTADLSGLVQKSDKLVDSGSPSNYWMTVGYGTATVWRVSIIEGNPVTNSYSVALEDRVVNLDLTDDATLTIPADLYNGQTVRWWVTQSGTGLPHTLTPHTDVLLPDGSTTMTLPSDGNAVSLIVGSYDAVAGVVRLTGFLKFAR